MSQFPFLDPPQSDDEIGRIGPYRVTHLLGRGGMGYVFAAIDSRLRRDVAIKLLRDSMSTSPEAKRKFIAEARSMAAISHDNVVTVFEVGTHQGMPLMAMERLAGDPLNRCISRKDSFSIDDVLRIAGEVADGLAAAADRGIVHRDIKPGNVWIVQPGGRVKILDFGLAVVHRNPILPETSRPVTRTHTIVGSPGYLSPEQVRGDAVDGRTDLYSLGVMMYRMIAGELPLKSDSMVSQFITTVCHQPISLSSLNPETPSAVSNLVDRLLSKEPRHRYRSARDLSAALAAVRAEIRSEANPVISVGAAPSKRGGLKPGAASKKPATSKTRVTADHGGASAANRVSNASPSPGGPIRASGQRVFKLQPAHAIAALASISLIIAIGLWIRPGQSPKLTATNPDLGRTAQKTADQNPSAVITPNRTNPRTGADPGRSATATLTRSAANETLITAAQLSPLKLVDAATSSTSVALGDAVIFTVEIQSDADHPAGDPRRLAAGNSPIAQINTTLSSEITSPRRMGFPRKLSARTLPAPGKAVPVTIQFFTGDLPVGDYQCQFELQTPGGITTQSTTSSITIVDPKTTP